MKQYLTEIDSFSDYIKVVSKWNSSNEPFGHLPGSENSYLYEFWCYTKILIALNENPQQVVRLKEGTRSFPKSPAEKREGWSYFEIYDHNDKLRFQVCAGTGIRRSDAPTSIIHPDISFQVPSASDEPTDLDTLLIMDAKFQSETSKSGNPKKLKSMPVDEIHTFAHRVNVLNTKGAHNISLDFGTLSQLKGNCLLSNAEVNKNHDKACEVDCVKQVGKFTPANVSPDVIGK